MAVKSNIHVPESSFKTKMAGKENQETKKITP